MQLKGPTGWVRSYRAAKGPAKTYKFCNSFLKGAPFSTQDRRMSGFDSSPLIRGQKHITVIVNRKQSQRLRVCTVCECVCVVCVCVYVVYVCVYCVLCVCVRTFI